ncbi:MAG TPA: hypothetical protein VJM82_06135 [Nitrospiraceae bacterium]|nr:hypothetical protein [Nitrospiraceae bacterium]
MKLKAFLVIAGVLSLGTASFTYAADVTSNQETLRVAVTTFIGSTIEEIDSAGLKVTVKTDQGESLSLSVANAEVMKGLTKGDRVSLELDVQGRVRKIVKIAPDLKIAPEPKG